MVRELMKDTVFLAQKALPAAVEDIPRQMTCWTRCVPMRMGAWEWRRT